MFWTWLVAGQHSLNRLFELLKKKMKQVVWIYFKKINDLKNVYLSIDRQSFRLLSETIYEHEVIITS